MASSPYAAIPILAGVALCGGGVGAVALDLIEQRREQRERSERDSGPPETVLIRNLSYVTGDPASSKARLFLAGCTLYAALGSATGFLQADVLAGIKGGKAKGPLLVAYPIVIGLSGALLVLGVRLLPYSTYPRAGTALHVVTAGCFQIFSIVYCYETVALATDVFGSEATVAVARRAFAYIGVACLGLSFLFGGYVMGKTARLVQHDKVVSQYAANSQREADASALDLEAISGDDTGTIGVFAVDKPPSADHTSTSHGAREFEEEEDPPTLSGILTPEQVWVIRCWMAALVVVQLSIGIAVSAVAVTGAAEANLYTRD